MTPSKDDPMNFRFTKFFNRVLVSKVSKDRECSLCNRLFGQKEEFEKHKASGCDGKVKCPFCESSLIPSVFIAHREQCRQKMTESLSEDSLSLSERSQISASHSIVSPNQENINTDDCPAKDLDEEDAINDAFMVEDLPQTLFEADKSSSSSSEESTDSERGDPNFDPESNKNKAYKSKVFGRFNNRIFRKLQNLLLDECAGELGLQENLKRGQKTTTDNILMAKSDQFFSTVIEFALCHIFESKDEVLSKYGYAKIPEWSDVRQNTVPKNIYFALNAVSKGKTNYFEKAQKLSSRQKKQLKAWKEGKRRNKNFGQLRIDDLVLENVLQTFLTHR